MKFKVTTLIAFILLLAGAFVFFYIEDHRSRPVKAEENTDVTRDQLEQAYNDWWNSNDKKIESRLSYGTKFAVVHVGELNSDAYLDMWGLDLDRRHASLNPETKAIYFYDQDYIPSENDNMIVIHDANSLEVLLKEAVYRDQNEIDIPFAPISSDTVSEKPKPEDLVMEEGRLYSNTPMQIELLNDSGAIRLEFDGQIKELKVDEKAVFNKSKVFNGKTVRSKVVVTNYGMWDAINMKYVISDMDGGL
ncbi:hypothetical protein [Paenibacillus jiagnxiensis]|uniref:hypothetical protein n=1 Tax=Paenibacillus jiagnxiensis TaxID=3228926 RepID=UPI0033AC9C01